MPKAPAVRRWLLAPAVLTLLVSAPVPAFAAAPAEAGHGVVVVHAVPGPAPVPVLERGRPADLSLLTDAEREVVARADRRAASLRRRPLVVQGLQPGTELEVVQTRHAFPFGFALDLRRLRDPADLAFFTRVTRDHFSLAVTENSGKWSSLQPAPDVRTYGRFEDDLAWAESHGFDVKGHTLLWGILPGVSRSGVPAWVEQRYPLPGPLSPAKEAELRGFLRAHVTDMVSRYRGRVSVWDVTNETLALPASYYVDLLGPGIVADAFRWARQADPDATLVFNEWIVEVLTGFAAPTAEHVRDRVLELRAQGVPIDAVGQQAHFAPALALAGLPVPLDSRTPVDAYAAALDTLAETGLPVHITETSFIAPDDPELRAAQAEALLRLWWGHPSVEQVVFWGPWNEVAGLEEFDVGIWNDDRSLSRHGEATLSLLNDRFRTEEILVADQRGHVVLDATHGEYAVAWMHRGEPMHARFRVPPGEGPVRVVLAGPKVP